MTIHKHRADIHSRRKVVSPAGWTAQEVANHQQKKTTLVWVLRKRLSFLINEVIQESDGNPTVIIESIGSYGMI